MLTYFLPEFNSYQIRTKQLPSGSNFLRVDIQNMLTNDSYSFLNSPGQWSYNECESIVSVSFNLAIASNAKVGDEFRMFLTPAITSSTTPFTYLDPVWHGSLQVFASQSVDKPSYVNQIPVDEEFKSRQSDNEFVYWSQTPPVPPTTTTTTLSPTTTTTAAPTTTTTLGIDIVRSGLVYAFDWTSFRGDGTLNDKSVNGYDATYFGNLTTSSNALQFDGTSSYIAFDINANTMYQSWKWTVDTYGTIHDISDSFANGQLIAYNNTNPTPNFPEWAFLVQTSGSGNNDLAAWNQLVNTFDSPVTASLSVPHQWTYLGRESGSGVSAISLSVDTNPLTLATGTGFNPWPSRAFNGNGVGLPGAISSASLQFFGGPEITYTSPFGPIQWDALSGSIKYILYYNRDLSDAELIQNNTFFTLGAPIPQN